MSSVQNPARLGAVGHTSQGAAQGVVPYRSLHDVSPTVLTHNDDVAQDRTVYKAASHVLSHASPVIILGGQNGEMRPREVKGLAADPTAEDYQGRGCSPWAVRR